MTRFLRALRRGATVAFAVVLLHYLLWLLIAGRMPDPPVIQAICFGTLGALVGWFGPPRNPGAP